MARFVCYDSASIVGGTVLMDLALAMKVSFMVEFTLASVLLWSQSSTTCDSIIEHHIIRPSFPLPTNDTIAQPVNA